MGNKSNINSNNTNLQSLINKISNLPTATTWNGGTTITPGTSDIEVPAYSDKKLTIKGDSNLQSANIKTGVSIFGVNGSLDSGLTVKVSDTVINTTTQGGYVLLADTDTNGHFITFEVASNKIYVNLYNATYNSDGFITSTSLITTLDTTSTQYTVTPKKITDGKWLICTGTGTYKMVSISNNLLYLSSNSVSNSSYVRAISFIVPTSVANKYLVFGYGNSRGYSDTTYSGYIFFTIAGTNITQNGSSSSGAFNARLGVQQYATNKYIMFGNQFYDRSGTYCLCACPLIINVSSNTCTEGTVVVGPSFGNITTLEAGYTTQADGKYICANIIGQYNSASFTTGLDGTGSGYGVTMSGDTPTLVDVEGCAIMPGHIGSAEALPSNNGIYVYISGTATSAANGNLLVVIGKHGQGTVWNIFKNKHKYDANQYNYYDGPPVFWLSNTLIYTTSGAQILIK